MYLVTHSFIPHLIWTFTLLDCFCCITLYSFIIQTTENETLAKLLNKYDLLSVFASRGNGVAEDVCGGILGLKDILKFVLLFRNRQSPSILLLHILLVPNRILNDQEVPIERKKPFALLLARFYLKRVLQWATKEYVLHVYISFILKNTWS